MLLNASRKRRCSWIQTKKKGLLCRKDWKSKGTYLSNCVDSAPTRLTLGPIRHCRIQHSRVAVKIGSALHLETSAGWRDRPGSESWHSLESKEGCRDEPGSEMINVPADGTRAAAVSEPTDKTASLPMDPNVNDAGFAIAMLADVERRETMVKATGTTNESGYGCPNAQANESPWSVDGIPHAA